MKPAPGSIFAGYRIIRLLGEGGMGAVFLAQHPRLPRDDALKILTGGLATDPAFRGRFEREADIAARLRHPNIVSVYDRGQEGEHLWIAMQYVEGRDAADLTKGADALPADRVLDIISDVGKALDYAHKNGMLHRDVKPANILVTPPIDQDSRETALLTDFGIARASAAAEQSLTLPGDVLGTFAYSAPEQLSGHHVDHRADIYALGCTLHELLTGSKPYPRDSMAATMHAHLSAPPPRPTQMRPQLSPAIDQVVARALAKDPAQRYNTCRELVEDARRALQSRPTPASFMAHPQLPPPPSPSSRKRPVLIGAAVLAVVALVGAGVAIVLLNTGSDDTGGTTAKSSTSKTTSTEDTTTTSTRPEGPTADAADDSFDVSVPSGWEILEPDDLLKLSAEDGNANLLVSINPTVDRGGTVEESADLGSKQITESLEGAIDPGGIVATYVDGETGWSYTYNLFAGKGGIPNDARGRQVFVRHDGTEYLITFTGTPEAFNRAVADYEAILRSWQWKE